MTSKLISCFLPGSALGDSGRAVDIDVMTCSSAHLTSGDGLAKRPSLSMGLVLLVETSFSDG